MIRGNISLYKSIEMCYLRFYEGDNMFIKLNSNIYDYIFKNTDEISIYYIFKIENLSRDKFIEMIKSKDGTIQCMIIDIILNNKI
jgi:hypothetical protein